ncbi:MAG: hypothetical protein ABSF70_06390 [Terracidiphilus sp.]|jgi:uncharacterized membrane protein
MSLFIPVHDSEKQAGAQKSRSFRVTATAGNDAQAGANSKLTPNGEIDELQIRLNSV